MENPEILKLKEKVQKDPASTLFVPLAELYRKEGLFDDAIEVLKDGIRRQPGYTSARVSLGKIYFEKGLMFEAEEELKGVVSEVPNNLFAHKKLAEIYTDRGDMERAVSHYRTLVSLNPMDEEAQAFLKNAEEALKKKEAEAALEKSGEAETVVEERPFFDDTQETEPIVSDDPFAGMDGAGLGVEEVSLDGMEEVPFPSMDEVAPMPEIEEVEAEAVSVEEEAPLEVMEEVEAEVEAEVVSVGEEALPAGMEEVSFSAIEEEVEAVPEEEVEVEAVPEEEVEVEAEVYTAEVEEETGPSEVTFDGFIDEGGALEVQAEGEHSESFGAVEVDGLVEAASGDGEASDEDVVIDGFIDEDMEEVEVVGEEDSTPKILSQDEVDNLLGQTTGFTEVSGQGGGWPAGAGEEEDAEEEAYVVDLQEEETGPAGGFDPIEADAAIAIGDYKKALEIYSAELERNPDNRDILQRADELKGLMKLLGMGSDKVVKKLEGFLENIKARKDEFYGSP